MNRLYKLPRYKIRTSGDLATDIPNVTADSDGLHYLCNSGARFRPWSSIEWIEGDYTEIKEQRSFTMVKDLKDYLSEHKDMIFTIVLLALADALFLNGALRTKLESILHRVADKLEAKTLDVTTVK